MRNGVIDQPGTINTGGFRPQKTQRLCSCRTRFSGQSSGKGNGSMVLVLLVLLLVLVVWLNTNMTPKRRSFLLARCVMGHRVFCRGRRSEQCGTVWTRMHRPHGYQRADRQRTSMGRQCPPSALPRGLRICLRRREAFLFLAKYVSGSSGSRTGRHIAESELQPG